MTRLFYSSPHGRSLLILSTLVLFLPTLGHADATLSLYPTYHSMGVIVTIDSSDDPDQDATVAVTYRTGSAAFKSGFPLTRVASQRFVGSLFRLTPATAYDVEITLSDPDGGPLNGTTRQLSTATRTEPLLTDPANSFFAAPAGSGTACTPQAPCALAQALQQAQPGDAVILRGGVYYTGGIQPPRSGSDGAPIVVRSFDGETAILDGSDPALTDAGWDHQGNGVYTTPLNTTDPHYVMADGQRLFPYESLSNLQSLTRGVPGFVASGATLYVHLENDIDPNTVDVSVARFNYAFYVDGQDFIYFSDLTFRFYGQGSWAKAIYFNNASDNLVQNCVFAYNDLGIGIKRDSHRNTFQDNEFYDAIFDWPWQDIKDMGGLEDGGISVYDPMTGRGTVIRRNIFHDDFDALGPSPGETAGITNETDVYDNIFYKLGDDGVSADGRASNVRIWGNTFYDVLIGISLAPVYGGPVYCLRNVVHRTGVGNNNYTGSSFKFNSGYDTSGPMYLFHNTSDAYYAGNASLSIRSPGTWENVYARNNIWSGTTYAIYNVNTSQSVDLNYDGLYTTLPGELVYWGSSAGRHMRDLATFQQLTGQELHGRHCNPDFADAAAGKYRLAPSSCLIDKGLVIPGINDGYAGEAPDMGAYEYQPPNLRDVQSTLRVMSDTPVPNLDAEKDIDGNQQMNLKDANYFLQESLDVR